MKAMKKFTMIIVRAFKWTTHLLIAWHIQQVHRKVRSKILPSGPPAFCVRQKICLRVPLKIQGRHFRPRSLGAGPGIGFFRVAGDFRRPSCPTLGSRTAQRWPSFVPNTRIPHSSAFAVLVTDCVTCRPTHRVYPVRVDIEAAWMPSTASRQNRASDRPVPCRVSTRSVTGRILPRLISTKQGVAARTAQG